MSFNTSLLNFNQELEFFPSILQKEKENEPDTDTIQYLESIDRVILSNNLLHSAPIHLASCPALRVLDLSHNRLTSLPMNLSSALPRLEKLIVNNNMLSDLKFLEGEGSVCGLLQSLWIQHNNISPLEATALSLQKGCPSLRVLVIYSNPCVSNGLIAQEKLFTSAANSYRHGKSLHRYPLIGNEGGTGPISPIISPSQHYQQLFLQQYRGYLPTELLFMNYCSDLRGIVVTQPILGNDMSTVEILSDGSAINAERLLALSPQIIHRVGPAAIDAAKSWYNSSTITGYKSFIQTVTEAEKESMSLIAASSMDAINEKKQTRVRIPLADVLAKVPSRFVQAKGGKSSSTRNGQQGGIAENHEISEPTIGRSVTPPPLPSAENQHTRSETIDIPRGENAEEGTLETKSTDKEIEEIEILSPKEAVVSSPTTDAMALLADVRKRTAGLLAAVSELPDVTTLSSLGASGKRATASALAIQQATQGGLQSGKKREDPEITRLLKNIPTNGSEPLLIGRPELFTVDEQGSLHSVALSADGSVFISQEGEIKTNISDDSNELTPAGSVRLRKDGTLIVRWPSGATAFEVTVDERTSLALSKWRSSSTLTDTTSIDAAVGAGGRAASILKSTKTRTLLPSDTRCYSFSAFSRESTGKSRILSASIDGLGCGTITGSGSTTLALLQLGGSGYHTTGQGKSAQMQRSWDSLGRFSIAVGSGYKDVLPPQQAEDDMKSIPISDSQITSSKKEKELPSGGEAVDPTISAARAMVAAALASAEASNAAVQAIMRSRATLEKLAPDPRKIKASEELILRRALIKIVSPTFWSTAPSDFVVNKANRSSPVLGGPTAVAFPLGQNLGIVVEIGEGSSRTFFVLIFFDSLRFVIKLSLM